MTDYVFTMNPGRGKSTGRDHRDAIDFSFISAGGGKRYRRAVEKLEIGDRVWLTPADRKGIVAVGEISGAAMRSEDAKLTMGSMRYKFTSLPLRGTYHSPSFPLADDYAEYVRPVTWLVRRSTGIRLSNPVTRYVQTVTTVNPKDLSILEQLFGL